MRHPAILTVEVLRTRGQIVEIIQIFHLSPRSKRNDSETLEIRFHYGIDNVDCYHLNINGIVDCRTANAGEPVADGKLVLACEGWKLVKSIRPKEDGDAEDTDGDSSKEPLGKSRSIFDLFDDIVGCSSCLSDLFRFPSFPKFPDISNMIEETRKNIEKGIEKSKGGDGNVKFYDFSCRIDPDGKVHLKRSSNDGTVEKEFKLGDGSEKAKKIEVKDSDDPKTELKSLVK